MFDFKPENRRTSKRKRSTSVSQKELIIVKKKQKKSVEDGKQIVIAENLSQRLLVKRKPMYFVDAISRLNEEQINSVKELGFESVLHFKIDYIPSRLALALLNFFEENRCKIKLNNGKKIISLKKMWSLYMDSQEVTLLILEISVKVMQLS